MKPPWSPPSASGWEWFGKVGDRLRPTIDGRRLGAVRHPDHAPLMFPLMGLAASGPPQVIGLGVAVVETPGLLFARGFVTHPWWAGLLFGRPLPVGLELTDVDESPPAPLSGTLRALVAYAPGSGQQAAWPDVAIHLRDTPGAARIDWTGWPSPWT